MEWNREDISTRIGSGMFHLCDMYRQEDFIFFSAMDFNGLFRKRRGESICEFLGAFPGEEISGERLHRKVIHRDGVLYFTPFRAHGISTYHMRTGRFEYFPIRGHEHRAAMYSNALRYGDTLYLIPENENEAFLLFDMNEGSFQEMDAFWQRVREQIDETEMLVTESRASLMVGNRIYILFSGTRYVAEMDLQGNRIEVHCAPKGYELRNIYYDGTFFWFTAMDRPLILRSNLDFGDFGEYGGMEGTDNITYGFVEKCQEHLLVFPYQGNVISEIDTKGKRIISLAEIPARDEKGLNTTPYFKIEAEENRVICYPCSCHGIYIYDLAEGRAEREALAFGSDCRQYLKEVKLDAFGRKNGNGFIIQEGEYQNDTLENFVKWIQKSAGSGEKDTPHCGREIWQYLIGK